MPSVQFLADMNVSPLTVRALVAKGWNVVRVSDLLPRTAPDTDILQLARDTNRVIIT